MKGAKKEKRRKITEEPIAGLAVDVHRLFDEETGDSILVSVIPKELEEGVERHRADVHRVIGGIHLEFHEDVSLANGDEFFIDNLSYKEDAGVEIGGPETSLGLHGSIDVLVRRKKR